MNPVRRWVNALAGRRNLPSWHDGTDGCCHHHSNEHDHQVAYFYHNRNDRNNKNSNADEDDDDENVGRHYHGWDGHIN
jgi:hypothetical protein